MKRYITTDTTAQITINTPYKEKKSCGERRVRLWQVWIHWEPLGQTSTYGGTGTWAVFQRHEAALELEHRACVTEQPYSGVHCSPRMGKGLINPALKIACFASSMAS